MSRHRAVVNHSFSLNKLHKCHGMFICVLIRHCSRHCDIFGTCMQHNNALLSTRISDVISSKREPKF